MRITKQSSNIKPCAITIAVLLIICVGCAFAYNHFYHKAISQGDSADMPTNKQIVLPEYDDPSAKQTGVDDIETSDGSAPSAAFPTTQPNLTVSLSSITQSSKKLIVETEIAPQLNEGSCTIRLSRDGNILTEKEISVQNNKCTNQNIDISSINPGQVDVTVLIRSGDNVANSTKSFTIK